MLEFRKFLSLFRKAKEFLILHVENKKAAISILKTIKNFDLDLGITKKFCLENKKITDYVFRIHENYDFYFRNK